MGPIPRRRVLQGTGLVALAALLPAELLASCTTEVAERPTTATAGKSTTTTTISRAQPWLVFSDHEAAVVEEAAARLIPGPHDDPAEAGHPGAREANVVRYIDTMLGALTVSPAKVFAGGPFSGRAGAAGDDMAHFIGLSPAEEAAWKGRLGSFRDAYAAGVAALDAKAAGDFASATNDEKDTILAADDKGFMTMLFGHAIEGMYSVPEYGGNAGLVGWTEIKFPGDVQPRGYTATEVSASDGPDVYVPTGVGKALLKLIAVANEQ